MEQEETQGQEGLTMPEQAPASLLPGVLARLEQRRTAVSGHSIDALCVQLAHTQWEIRAAAIRALSESEARTGQDANTIREMLLVSLQDEHRLVRVAAVRALGCLSIDVPVDRLLLSLRDPDWEVREMAVLTLGKLSGQSLNPLQALLQVAQQDTHSSVREAATYALQTYHDVNANNSTGSVQKIEPVRKDITASRRRSMFLPGYLTRYLSILVRQIPLIHKSIWFVSPLFLILWFVQNAYLFNGAGRNIHEAGLYLAFFSTISAGAGSAFIYGAEHDVAFELTLSTPASLRLLMLSRFILAVGYNVLLVGGASVAMVLFYGGGLWDIMQLWLGPVLLISSLSLMLSLMLGYLLALLVAFLLEASQSLVFGLIGHTPMLAFSFSNNWQTSPLLLLLAIVALAIALFYAPRQPRFATV